MIFKARISRSCTFWGPEAQEWRGINIEAETEEEAIKQLKKEAIKLEMSSAYKFVKDVEIEINGEWKEVISKRCPQ